MDCLFFRHGIAIERQEWSGREQDRPLTDKGAARTRESGKGLLNLRIKPTHIFSSPLARAYETAVILQSLIRSNPKIRICSELDPTAAPRTLFALLDALVFVVKAITGPRTQDDQGCSQQQPLCQEQGISGQGANHESVPFR